MGRRKLGLALIVTGLAGLAAALGWFVAYYAIAVRGVNAAPAFPFACVAWPWEACAAVAERTGAAGHVAYSPLALWAAAAVLAAGFAVVPGRVVLYVRSIDTLNRIVGRFAMYLLYVLAAILSWSILSRLLFGSPVNWAMEMSQFVLSAYYLLGAAYSLQLGAHVRMDLFYGQLSPRNRAVTDALTILFVIFYLGVLAWGGVSSTEYSVAYNQVNYTAWAPPMWPIKSVMTLGIVLMLLQAISTFFKDAAMALGRPLP